MTNDTLEITDIKKGEGKEAKKGSTIAVHYTGWLFEPEAQDNKGEQFDSSVSRGEPFEFPLGVGMVIQGWEEGFSGMKIGGKRKLTIPAHMAYGERGAGGSIPPNATLVFEVELLDVK